MIAQMPHHQGLQDPVALDAGGEGGDFVLVEVLARLKGVLLDEFHRHFALKVLERIGTAQKCVQTAAEAFFFHGRTP